MSRIIPTESVKLYLQDLFKELEHASVQCCLLQWNIELWNGKDDLDILVDPMSIDLAVCVATLVAKKHNWVITYEVRDTARHHYHIFISLSNTAGNNTEIIHVDFQSSIFEAGCVFLKATDVFDHLETRKGLPCPSPTLEATLRIVRAVVGKGYFKPHYWSFIKEIHHKRELDLGAELSRVLSPQLSSRLLYYIKVNNETGVLAQRSNFIASAKEPRLTSQSYLFTRLARRIRWLIIPSGAWINISGFDCKKSSRLSESIIDSLKNLPIEVTALHCRKKHLSEYKAESTGASFQTLIYLARHIIKIRNNLARNRVVLTIDYDQYSMPILRKNFQPDAFIRLALQSKDSEDNIVALSEAKSLPHTIANTSQIFIPDGHKSVSLENMLSIHNALLKITQSKKKTIFQFLNYLGFAQGGFTISVIGLDGSGKGTYIELLLKYYKEQGVSCKCCYLGYSAYQLPLVRTIEKLRSANNIGSTYYRLMSICYLALLPVEFLFRRGTGKYDVIITDRHPRYEPIFRGRICGLYDKFNSWLCPQPDVVLYLTGDDETLWSRKREYDFHVYKKRRTHLDSLVYRYIKNVPTIRINTVGYIADVFSKVQNAIKKFE